MAGTVKCYMYDPRTFVYVGYVDAEVINGQPNMPAFSTTTAPQEKSQYEGQSLAPFWNENTQAWELRQDFYDKTFYDIKTLQPVQLLHGELPDFKKVCNTLPEDPNMVWDSDWVKWVIPLPVAKEYKKKEIKEAWFKSTGGPYKTGVVGKIANADTGKEEEVDLIVNLTESDRELLKQKPFLTAIEWANYDKIKATPAEIKQLKRGVYVERIMDLIADMPIVVRDYLNRYVAIKISDLDDVLWAQVEQDDANLHRKWAIEELIDQCTQEAELNFIHWGMDLPEDEA